MSRLSDFYEYDLSKVIKFVNEFKAKKVLIQIPDGFKHYVVELINELSTYLNDVHFVVDANPIYGSCILNNYLVKDYDLVLHFGHEPYPYYRGPDNVVFIDFLSKLRPTNELVSELVSSLNSLGCRKVSVYTVHQHKKSTEVIGRYLMSYGFEVLNNLSNATIMGCWFNDALRYLDLIDCYVVVSSGLFHPLGLGLLTTGRKHIVQLDLYRGEVRVVDDEVSKYLRIRYSKVMEALDSRVWCLIHGVEGQYREFVRDSLIKTLRSRGLRYYEYRTHIVNEEVLRNIDTVEFNVYVITSCPRIPIDDLSHYEKPVLTPGEALMVLKGLRDYVFPWSHNLI